jgi:hypothetical protein
VGAAPSMFAWHLVVATMIATGESYRELNWCNKSCLGRYSWMIRSKICWLDDFTAIQWRQLDYKVTLLAQSSVIFQKEVYTSIVGVGRPLIP